MGPDFLVFTVYGPALEANSDIAFIGIDGGNLRSSPPSTLLFVVRFEPYVNQVSDTVTLQLHWCNGLVPVSALQALAGCDFNDICSGDLSNSGSVPLRCSTQLVKRNTGAL